MSLCCPCVGNLNSDEQPQTRPNNAVMECQTLDYPKHKNVCNDITARCQKCVSEERATPLTDLRARELVESAADELDGRWSTTSSRMPDGAASQIYDDRVDWMPEWDAMGDTAFVEIRKLCRMGPDCERLLGRAGACILYANALDHVVAGQSWLPLFCVLDGIAELVKTSRNNRVAFGKSKGVENLTRVLTDATRQHAWHIVDAANSCIMLLLLENSLCPKFASAGTIDAVLESLVAGTLHPEGLDVSYDACLALAHLKDQAIKCTDPKCQHKLPIQVQPGVLQALDACLDSAITAMELGNFADPDEPQGLANHPALEFTNLLYVLRAINVTIATETHQPAENREVMATERVCQNLVRTCALALSPPFRAWDSRLDNHWSLATVVCTAIDYLCRNWPNSVVPGKLRGACVHVVNILRVANTEGYDQVRQGAIVAVSALARDPSGNATLVTHGAVAEVMDALARVPKETKHLRCHLQLNEALAGLSKQATGARELGALASEGTCKLLVESFTFILESGKQGLFGGKYTSLIAAVVDHWLRMTEARPACRNYFLAAGAKEALTQAVAAAEAAMDTVSANTFRTLRREVFMKLSQMMARHARR
eukprot:jgi/Mesvir1/17113/Mv07548-RA.1